MLNIRTISPRSSFQRGFFTLFKTSSPREHIEAPPSLPDPQKISVQSVENECVIEYVDVRPSSQTPIEKTFIFLHGAPGTYQDFRYLIAQLRKNNPNDRMIGINLPGFGGSYIPNDRYYELISALPAIRLTLQAINCLCSSDERIFLIGHSFGGHAAINIGALNITENQKRLNIRGLVLLASAGLEPHRAMKPRVNAVVNQLLQMSIPLVSSHLPYLIKWFFTSVFEFPSQFPPSHYVAGIFRSGTTNFSIIHRHVHQLRDEHVPTFCAWSANDALMETSVPLRLAETLRSQRQLSFKEGGHNIQKTRADVLADNITQWTHCVLSNTSSCKAKVDLFS